MNKFRLILFSLAAFSIGFSSCSEQANREVEDIQPVDLEQKMQETGGILLDVRTDEEVARGKIPGARQIDFYDGQFMQKAKQLNKEEPVYLYCRSGGRSSEAAGMLKKEGFKEVYNLDGGITAWQEQGLEVEE